MIAPIVIGIATFVFVASSAYLDWQWIKRVSVMFDDVRAARAFCDAGRENRTSWRYVKWRDTDIVIKHPVHRRWEFISIIENSQLPFMQAMAICFVVVFQILMAGCMSVSIVLGGTL